MWQANGRTEENLLGVPVCRDYVQGMNERIEMNPRVCGGRPVIKGTRIPVEVILGQLAEGESWEALLKGYPELTRADIQAALRFAEASVVNSEITELAPA